MNSIAKNLSQDLFDLVIVGAGSGGLVAADFAARLGVRVALVERDRIGGDCTWTGCVPSKALVKAARLAHQVRTSARLGIDAGEPSIDMAKVRDGIREAIERVYRGETPEALERKGITVIPGAARFTAQDAISVGNRTIRARKFVITTGARPALPPIRGLEDVPHATYETIFDNDRLPRHLIVVGGGPVGAEVVQAYRRLGSMVTIIAPRLLPAEDEETHRVIQRVFEREGIRFHHGRVVATRMDGADIVVDTDSQEEARGDLLLVATGRRPNIGGLGLDAAGVIHADGGIPVDRRLRTNMRHIYAAGDVVGGPQFTHFAGWQGFHAAKAALLPGGGADADLVPRVTFTDPEVAHVGPDLQTCRERYGDGVQTRRIDIAAIDRAASDHESDGFIRLVVRGNEAIVAATVVAPHAGETLGELVVAIKNRVHASALADTMHPYPIYATGIQQLAFELALDKNLSGVRGRLARWLAGGHRNPDTDAAQPAVLPARNEPQ